MGVTQRLGTIPLAIQTDSSNNVGIGGAANASYKLAVTGAATITGNLGIGGGANERLTITGPSGLAGMARWTDATTGSAFLGFTSGGTAYIHSNSNALSFGANGSNNFAATMTLTSGNVGIGTSNPTAPLDLWKSGGTAGLLASFTDGTYSNLQISTTTTGTLLQTTVSSYLAFGTTQAERMRITSAGNVCIGTTTSSGYGNINLDLNAGASNAAYFVIRTGNNSTIAEYALDGGAAYLSTKTNHSIRIRTNDVERMRINDGSGEVLMHSTSFNSALDGQLFGAGGDTYFTRNAGGVLWLNRKTNDGILLTFQKDNVNVGTISTNSNSLPSDFNFKKNINNLELGLNLITKLRPVSYNHKIDDDDAALSTGFIAQELESTLEELGVEKNKYYILQNIPNEDKNQSQYWLDYTKIIPVLTKSIQEQQEIINQLSSKVTALENK